jgi:hypothetical protein
MRTSILEGLSDRDCPGLEHELRMQHASPSSPLAPSPSRPAPQSPKGQTQAPERSPAGKASLKRPASESNRPESAVKHARADSQGHVRSSGDARSAIFSSPSVHSSAVLGTPQGVAMQLQPSPASSGAGLQSPFMQRDATLHVSSSSDDTVPPRPPPIAPTPSRPTPSLLASPLPLVLGSTGAPPAAGSSLKRWPNDYTVSEVSAGFARMDALVRATPSVKQSAAFERVFGCRYVKSTFCRHRGVWKRAEPGVRARFERMGPVEHALWGEFVKCTDPQRRDGAGAGASGQRHRQDAADERGVRDRSPGSGQGKEDADGFEYAMDPVNSLGLGVGVGADGQRRPQVRPPMASLAPSRP